MGGAEEEAAGVGVGIPLHLGGNVYQRAGAGLKRKASWLHNLLVPLGVGKGWSQYHRGMADIRSYLPGCFLTSLKGVFYVIHFHLGS